MSPAELTLLTEAYENYQKTGNKHFTVIPKNSEYLLFVINSVPDLQERGYITNVSDNLLNEDSISLVPLEDMSFDITFRGIEFIEKTNRKR